MKVQSNGMGQQSAALYLMSSLGVIPRFDYSIFADPGREKKKTYSYLKWLLDWQKKNDGIPLIVDRSKNLFRDILKKENSTGHRWASLPAYSEGGGMIRRQCTREYKIDIVEKNIRELQGKKKGQTFDPVDLYFGISLDEIRRMAYPSRKNVTHRYPFCGYGSRKKIFPFDVGVKMTRSEINQWMKAEGFPVPPKSSCVFCPFQSDANWLDMKKNNPEDFKAAVRIDKEIRDASTQGVKNKIYLHKSCKPLDKVDFKENQTEIQFDCMGYCGV